MIPIYRPYFLQSSFEHTQTALARNEISHGPHKSYAAAALAERVGVRHAILTCNGTAATHLLFLALRYIRPNLRRIFFPNNAYVAVWNASLFDQHKHARIAVDADLKTWNANYSGVCDDPTSAIVVAHTLGGIVNVPALRRRLPNVLIVEDNCEGFTGSYEGRPSGSESLCSSVSFFGNKTITTGEGGAFFTNDDEVFKFIIKVFSQGQTQTRYIHDTLAYNYRMSNIQAAILCGQLKILAEIKQQKARVFQFYRERLNGHVIFPEPEPGTIDAQWMAAIRAPGNPSYPFAERVFAAQGIETRPLFYPLSSHSHLKNHFLVPTEQNAALLNRECVVLPSFPALTEQELDHICTAVLNFVE